MSTSTNPNVVTLTVTRDAALYIIDCVSERPFKQVAPLLRELEAQVQVQINTQAQSGQSPEADALSEETAKAQEEEPAPSAAPGTAKPWPWRRPATSDKASAS